MAINPSHSLLLGRLSRSLSSCPLGPSTLLRSSTHHPTLPTRKTYFGQPQPHAFPLLPSASGQRYLYTTPISHFGTTSARTASKMSSSGEEDFSVFDEGNESDDYVPTTKTTAKKAAPKKTAAAAGGAKAKAPAKPKATTAAAKKQPLAKRKSNEAVGDESADFSMSIIDAVEGPAAKKPANTNKSASETYQKVRGERPSASFVA